MGLFNRKKEKQVEERAVDTMGISDTANDVLLQALLGTASVTKQTALNIPSLNGCIDYISSTICMLPIKLYEEKDGKVIEIKDDIRVKILNDDPGDTLDSVQFWKAFIGDYFLGKGGYAYKEMFGNQFKSLRYVREEDISIQKNTDPIFKDYDILVNGYKYFPHDFIKILRNTNDGCQGKSILTETPLLMSVGYNTLKYEENLVASGGNKKGFLKSPKKLAQDILDALKSAFKKLYGNNTENVIVLNDGIEFQEASQSSVEMQLNENKETNSGEICKLFRIATGILSGKATEQDATNSFNNGVRPVIRAIECALNRDFLLEREKSNRYWAFDIKEMTKGDILKRYQAYQLGIQAKWLQPDEARYMEDLPSLGLDFIDLGLGASLYNPETKEIYTPNTNQKQDMNNLKGGVNDGQEIT